jgi:hypothetical protein
MPDYDAAGRTIAGLLTYNPGPGIYSRLERAIQAMPENVRTQELPGLLKRYKDGVPGWELKETDLDSVIAGRDVVPREELLTRVKERSPVYTHEEVVLGGSPPRQETLLHGEFGPKGEVERAPRYESLPVHQDQPSPIGGGVSHGMPRFEQYGHGGGDYSELLLVDPEKPARMLPSPHHFHKDYPGEFLDTSRGNKEAASYGTVAHARFDTHGDALRINELQSDLGIHNRKMREEAAQAAEILRERGVPLGALAQPNDLPFALEDAWADILIKRLALEAARKGHRAIEVASPRAIADKVGGNIDNYEHFYGKVIPGALERLGRKTGGLAPDSVGPELVTSGYPWPGTRQAAEDALSDMTVEADGYVGSGWGKDQTSSVGLIEDMVDVVRMNADPTPYAMRLRNHLVTQAVENGYPTKAAETLVDNFMPRLMRQADEVVALQGQHQRLKQLAADSKPIRAGQQAGRRYLMSDEMRRRILQEGIPAAVAVGIGADQLIDRLGQEQR